jgi:hypothetical protein
VIPEEDMQESGEGTEQALESPPSEINEENLSVFEDFLENLDIDDEDKGDQEDDDEKKKPT